MRADAMTPSTGLPFEDEGRERRQDQPQRARMAMGRHLLGPGAAAIPEIAAAIDGGVAVEPLAPEAGIGHANAVVEARHRREIAGDEGEAVRLAAAPQEDDDAVLIIIGDEPLEARRLEVLLVESRQLPVQAVEIAHQVLDAAMERIGKEMPIEAPVVAPLALLGDLAAHEQQLLARMAEHEAVIGAQIGEALPAVAGHLPEQRALPVHHFVMAQGQYEILGEGVEEPEGQPVVMPAPMHGIVRHIGEGVVHPPHVPLVAEAEPAEIGRPRDAGPGRRLLGNGHGARMSAIDELVHPLQEGDRVQVLVAAIEIRDPFAGAAAVIEIEHRGDRIHAQAVDVIAVEPEERVAEEIVPHLAPAVIVDERLPILMEALARIGVLVEMGAVEIAEPMGIRGEMPGNPVDENAKALAMGAIDEAREARRLAEAARRRVEPDGLIAPRAVEGMLGDRQQLDVAEAHLLRIGHEPVGELVIGEEAPALLRHAPPRAEMDLVDRDRRVAPARAAATLQPGRVGPGLGAEIVHDRGGARRTLRIEAVGIGLESQELAVEPLDLVFVEGARPDTGDKELPDPAFVAIAHGQAPAVPIAEIADHADARGARRPDREDGSGDALDGAKMSAQALIALEMGALGQEMHVELAENRGKAIGVLEFRDAGGALAAQAIGEGAAPPGHKAGPETRGMHLLQAAKLGAARAVDYGHPDGVRQEDADGGRAIGAVEMQAEHGEGIAAIAVDHRLDRRLAAADRRMGDERRPRPSLAGAARGARPRLVGGAACGLVDLPIVVSHGRATPWASRMAAAPLMGIEIHAGRLAAS